MNDYTFSFTFRDIRFTANMPRDLFWYIMLCIGAGTGTVGVTGDWGDAALVFGILGLLLGIYLFVDMVLAYKYTLIVWRLCATKDYAATHADYLALMRSNPTLGIWSAEATAGFVHQGKVMKKPYYVVRLEGDTATNPRYFATYDQARDYLAEQVHSEATWYPTDGKTKYGTMQVVATTRGDSLLFWLISFELADPCEVN